MYEQKYQTSVLSSSGERAMYFFFLKNHPFLHQLLAQRSTIPEEIRTK